MKFPKAFIGMKKIFISEAISLVAALIAIAGTMTTIYGLLGKDEGMTLGGGIVSIFSGIALVVAFVFQLIGIIQAGKDEQQFKVALYFTIGGIVLTIVSSILGALTNAPRAIFVVASILEVFVSLCSVLVIYFILRGVSALAMDLGDEVMAEKGSFLANAVCVMFAFSIILNLLSDLFTRAANIAYGWSIFFAIIAIMALIVEVVIYIMVFIYYLKAVKMLKE